MATTTKKKTPTTTAPARSKTLKLTKDTLRDLATTARQARDVKGGGSSSGGTSKMGGGDTTGVVQ